MKHKSAAELAQAIKAQEQRLAMLKKQQHEQTAAEQARTNAAIIKALHRAVDALPAASRPKWQDMPTYIDTLVDKMLCKQQARFPQGNADGRTNELP